jgi:hypothetical protein
MIDSRSKLPKKLAVCTDTADRNSPKTNAVIAAFPAAQSLASSFTFHPVISNRNFLKQFLQIPIAECPTLIIILQISLLNEPRRRKEREGREERAFSHFQV